MESNPKTQSSASAVPPPGRAAAACPQPSGGAPALSILPLPRPPRSAGEATTRPDKTAAGKPPFAAGGLPATVGLPLAEALEGRWTSYRKQLRHCQEVFSEGAVHELRVATRRLLAQFVLLGSVVPSAELEKARRVLKRQMAALGDLRDTQVQLGFVDQQAARFPELAPLRRWLEHRERRLTKPAAKQVGRFGTKKLRKWIVRMAEDLAARDENSRQRRQLFSAVVRAAANAHADAVKRRRAIDLADLRTIHQTRVAFKRFRYMMESLSPDITGLSKRQLRALAYYQRKMGIIQDRDVMLRCVASFVREHKQAESSLRGFCRCLRQRRTRALRCFLKAADQLYAFWPPARLAAPRRPDWTRKAA